MEIGIKETKQVTFTPPVEASKDPEIMAAMSMAVAKIADHYQTLYRQVQRTPGQVVPESVLAFASGSNGVDFNRSGEIPIRPTQSPKSPDRLAVEDPTIVLVDGIYHVFHSAVEPKPSGKEGVLVSIQEASGPNLQTLEKNQKLILTPQDIKNSLGEADMVKEPEFFYANSKWFMIFEHTGKGKSEIAIAESPSLLGPYRNFHPLLETREGQWDSQHTSPGPILLTSRGDILMFYNGRGPKNKEDQTQTWAIGTVIIDSKTLAVSNRSEAPIIRPSFEIGPGGQLIAFANSVVEETGYNRLYYTQADKRSTVATLSIEEL